MTNTKLASLTRRVGISPPIPVMKIATSQLTRRVTMYGENLPVFGGSVPPYKEKCNFACASCFYYLANTQPEMVIHVAKNLCHVAPTLARLSRGIGTGEKVSGA